MHILAVIKAFTVLTLDHKFRNQVVILGCQASRLGEHDGLVLSHPLNSMGSKQVVTVFEGKAGAVQEDGLVQPLQPACHPLRHRSEKLPLHRFSPKYRTHFTLQAATRIKIKSNCQTLCISYKRFMGISILCWKLRRGKLRLLRHFVSLVQIYLANVMTLGIY